MVEPRIVLASCIPQEPPLTSPINCSSCKAIFQLKFCEKVVLLGSRHPLPFVHLVHHFLCVDERGGRGASNT